ncbi:hypothetical protein QQ045_029968 [Rhodiola kirilowii]
MLEDLGQAILFYKEYACIAGFVVRLSTSNMLDGIVTRKYLVCQWAGFKEKCKVVDTTKSIDHNEKSRRDTRCGCEARLLVNITDGGRYRAYSFEETHNHYLESDIGATVTDDKNFKGDLKLYIGLNDAQMVIDSLSDKKKTCQGYSFSHFQMGKAPFPDCFGFKTLLEREPSVIVTNQDASMKAAIATIFPSSRHWFCMWHITEKLQAKSINDNETGRMYIINDALRNNKLFQVIFTEKGETLNCSCMKLESCGYISRHLFKVMFLLRYDKIPDYMVMARWHTDASRKHNPEHASNGGVDCSSSKAEYFQYVLQMPQPADVVVNNPRMSRNKGCGKRIRGPREMAIEKSNKPLRSCGYCNEKGLHEKRTCPNRLVIKSRRRVAPSEDVCEFDVAALEQP